VPNTLDANFQPVYDNNGNQSDLKLSITGIAVNNLILNNSAHYIDFYGINTAGYLPSFNYNHGTGIVTSTGADFIWKSTGSLNNFEIDTSNAFFGMGHNSPVKFGAALSFFQVPNGVYFNAQTGFQNDWANYAYTLNAPNHIYNGALSGSSLMNAGMLNLGSHTFGVQHASASSVNYRGINLAYTINNTVAATGLASGINIEATLTNLNGMINEGFRYTISGISSLTAGSIVNTGIDLINSSPVTGSMGWQNSPSIDFEGKTLRGNIAVTSIVPGRTYIIQTVGTTNYTLIGSPNNTVGTVFTATSAGTGTGTVFESQPVIIRQSLRATNSREYNLVFESSILGGAFTEFGRFGWDQYGSPQFLMGSNSQITASSLFASAGGITAGRSNSLSTDHVIRTQGNAKTTTTGDSGNYIATLGFIATSGNATHSGYLFSATINQTGTANGAVRGVFVNPTLTAAADFRAYEGIVRNNHSDKALLLSNGASELFVVYGSGRIKAGALPTSSVGLGSREFWIDGNTIRITD
jgi:hypothetical protein